MRLMTTINQYAVIHGSASFRHAIAEKARVYNNLGRNIFRFTFSKSDTTLTAAAQARIVGPKVDA